MAEDSTSHIIIHCGCGDCAGDDSESGYSRFSLSYKQVHTGYSVSTGCGGNEQFVLMHG